MKKKQTGFTLIEIVAVIVLLGILAVTAVPRFVDLQSDARESALRGVAAAIQGTYTQIYAKALVEGATNSADIDITLNDGTTVVALAYGYPQAVDGQTDMMELVELDSTFIVEKSGTLARVGYSFDGDSDLDDDACFIGYTEVTATGDRYFVDSLTINGDAVCRYELIVNQSSTATPIYYIDYFLATGEVFPRIPAQ